MSKLDGDSPIGDKADYVRAQGHTQQQHVCHWPGCNKPVPPAKWGCARHWYRLPRRLRDRIWRAYRPGQERDKRPSAAYIEAARAARLWAEQQEP